MARAGDKRSAQRAPVIIIKKRKKRGHEGHHGGAWKVAYADFVTAMMAFFLLLWLLNVATSEQKQGVADYFAPASVSKSTSGSGGVLGGKTITTPGAGTSSTSPIQYEPVPGAAPGAAAIQAEDPDAEEPEEPTYQQEKPRDQAELLARLQQLADEFALPGDRPLNTPQDFGRRLDMIRPTYPKPRPDETRFEFQIRLDSAAREMGQPMQRSGETLSEYGERLDAAARGNSRTSGDRAASIREAQRFQAAATEIREAMLADPELQDVAESVLVELIPTGLRVQIIDDESRPMFPAGSSQMFQRTRQLVTTLARVMRALPNKITLTGHTDSRPFRPGAARDNWDLSAERANATRRVLMDAGVAESRFETVAGRSDREPLIKDDPGSPRNRRISILLHRMSPDGADTVTGP